LIRAIWRALARESRTILDEGDLSHVRIVASGSLDEFAVRDLVAAGAPIDAFGVGTSMGTVADRPFLDSVYKLVSYDGRGRVKLAEGKQTLPGLKSLFRKIDGAIDVTRRHRRSRRRGDCRVHRFSSGS
jgi:nicotinate phosphoribosyltransferase